MSDRFYCPAPAVDGRVVIEGEEAKHLARVRRLGAGDLVEVFDGKGFASEAEVTAVGRERVELKLIGESLPERTPPCRLTLASAVPKGERFDWLAEKATELGVATLVPLITERSVVDPRATKLGRLRRLTIEASKQSGRSRLLEITPPLPLPQLIREHAADVQVLAHLRGSPPALWPRVPRGGTALLAIGPEGGFTENELALAGDHGWTLGRLGATVLRVETAGLVGCSVLLAFCGDESG